MSNFRIIDINGKRLMVRTGQKVATKGGRIYVDGEQMKIKKPLKANKKRLPIKGLRIFLLAFSIIMVVIVLSILIYD